MKKKITYNQLRAPVLGLSTLLLTVGLMVGANLTSYSQTENPHTINNVQRFVDQQAEFPGGLDALGTFLDQHVAFSKKGAELSDVTGSVRVQFVVNRDGSISNIKILQSLDPEHDKAVVRAIRQMPRWTPAKIGDKDVRSYYIMPVAFK